MDLATVLTSVLSGAVIAALLAGAFNIYLKRSEYKNSLLAWNREQNRQHALWLRDLRLKTYSETLTYYKELETALGVPREITPDFNAKHIAALSSTDTQIELFGSPEVQAGYDEVRVAYASAVKTRGDTRSNLNRKISDLAGIMRNEIEAMPSEE